MRNQDFHLKKGNPDDQGAFGISSIYMSERENLGFQSGDESEHLVLPHAIHRLVYILAVDLLRT